jgi:hypothetical protein
MAGLALFAIPLYAIRVFRQVDPENLFVDVSFSFDLELVCFLNV